MTIRLPPDQMRRLDKVATHRKQTKQSFVQEFVMLAVAEIEENKRLAKQIKDRDDKPAPFSATDDSMELSGLGIANALKKQQRETEPPPPATAPVVVQVGNTAAPPSPNGKAPLGELDRLALFVVNGDEFMRDVRKRTVVEILRSTTETDEELKVLVARLEELVAIKTKTKSENTGFNKFAKLAFEKIESLLKGA